MWLVEETNLKEEINLVMALWLDLGLMGLMKISFSKREEPHLKSEPKREV